MRNLDATIKSLKENELLDNRDAYAFAQFYDRIRVGDVFIAAGGLFTFRWASVDYLIAANQNTLKIFNIDKKTGEYMGEHVFLEKQQIDKLVCKKYALINVTRRTKLNVRVREIGLKLDVLIGDKFRGIDQVANKRALVAVLKNNFVT